MSEVFPTLTPIEKLNLICKETAVSHLGIEFTQMTYDSITATLPVDERTRQPAGLLHGGCFALLAETLGGLASTLLIENSSQVAVGIEVTAKHVKSISSGFVTGTIKALHIGKRLHFWEVRMTNEKGDLLSLATITNQIISKT